MENLFSLLPTKMISKDDINGVKIDYEEYLTELLNESLYFVPFRGTDKFEKILEQAHGEADVIANGYTLDFKLLVPQEFVNAKLKSLPNVDYSNIKNGFICVNDKPVNNNLTQAQSNGLFIKFLQMLALAKKDQIKSWENDQDNTLYSTIKMIKKEKNLFIFLPCIININNGAAISNTVAKFLSSLFSLRDNIDKDTFVTLLGFDDYFYILKYESHKFKCVDKVHKILVSSFNDIYRLTYFLERD